MSEFIAITKSDLINIIKYSQEEGRRGNYVRSLFLIQPKTASQGIDSSIAIHASPLISGSESEPIPLVGVI